MAVTLNAGFGDLVVDVERSHHESDLTVEVRASLARVTIRHHFSSGDSNANVRRIQSHHYCLQWMEHAHKYDVLEKREYCV